MNRREFTLGVSAGAAATLINSSPARSSGTSVNNIVMVIDPDLERFMAKRMNATTIEIDAGHLSLVSHAQDVWSLIMTAAGAP